MLMRTSYQRARCCETFTSFAYRFKAYLLRAAQDTADLVIARYDNRAFGSYPSVELTRVIDAVLSSCAVRAPLT